MDTATIYSCDDHLDLRAVPPDLWSSRLSSARRRRGPRVVERDGEVVWVCDGRELGWERLRRTRPVSASTALNAIGRAGIDDDGYRAGNAQLRLEDLDRDGLAASVVYGPLAIGLPDRGSDAAGRVLRGVERLGCRGVQRGRARSAHASLPFLPSNSPAGRGRPSSSAAPPTGHRGAIIDVFDMDLGDPAWDRLWTVAQDTGLPISFHIKGGSWSGLSYQIGKWQAAAFATIMPLQLDEILATLIFSGVPRTSPGAAARAGGVGGRAGCRSSSRGPTWSGTR